MSEPYDIGETTRRELAGLRSSMVDVAGLRATRKALTLMQETGTDPGELVARYVLDCVRAGSINLVGYELNPDRRPHGAGFVHVVLDPQSMRITIYEEFY